MIGLRCLIFFLLGALLALAQSGSQPSINEITRKAETGDAQAQFELGAAYDEGRGVPQDDEAAAVWYKKSADQGNADAQNSLGVMYSLGRGVPRDKEEALSWYKKAARQGLPDADYNVATSYYNGDGVAPDLDRAYAWATISARHGSSLAADVIKRVTEELHGKVESGKYILGHLYEKGDETPADPERAFEVYMELAIAERSRTAWRQGEAELKVCQFYGSGIGVQQDLIQAYAWCRKAAKDFQPAAFVILGRMAEKGQGTEKNLKNAEIWYKDAALLRYATGFMELGRLKLQSDFHNDQREAYFWFYIAQFYNVREGPDQVRKAAVNLTDKERIAEQRRAQAWIKNTGPHDKLVFP